MENALAGVGPDVADETPRLQPVGRSCSGRHGSHVCENLGIHGVRHRRHVVDGNDQQVGGRRRIDVAEGQGMVRAIDDIGGNVPRNDLTEEAVGAQPLVRPILVKRVLKASSL